LPEDPIQEEEGKGFWSNPAAYFFKSPWNNPGMTWGGFILAIAILKFFGLLGAGIFLVVFYGIRAVIKKS